MSEFNRPPEIIREYLSYDPDTGVFVWIKRPNPMVAPGSVAGTVQPDKGYRLIHFRSRVYTAGRLAWFMAHDESPPLLIDHINGKRDDNRLANLRPATISQNAANQKGVGQLPKGVSRRSRRPAAFVAKIRVEGRSIYLGSHLTAEEAHTAYCAAAVKYFGEFARFE